MRSNRFRTIKSTATNRRHFQKGTTLRHVCVRVTRPAHIWEMPGPGYDMCLGIHLARTDFSQELSPSPLVPWGWPELPAGPGGPTLSSTEKPPAAGGLLATYWKVTPCLRMHPWNMSPRKVSVFKNWLSSHQQATGKNKKTVQASKNAMNVP